MILLLSELLPVSTCSSLFPTRSLRFHFNTNYTYRRRHRPIHPGQVCNPITYAHQDHPSSERFDLSHVLKPISSWQSFSKCTHLIDSFLSPKLYITPINSSPVYSPSRQWLTSITACRYSPVPHHPASHYPSGMPRS